MPKEIFESINIAFCTFFEGLKFSNLSRKNKNSAADWKAVIGKRYPRYLLTVSPDLKDVKTVTPTIPRVPRIARKYTAVFIGFLTV